MLRTFGWAIAEKSEELIVVLNTTFPGHDWIRGNVVQEQDRPARVQIVGKCSDCDGAFIQQVYGALALWNHLLGMQLGLKHIPKTVSGYRECLPCQEARRKTV